MSIFDVCGLCAEMERAKPGSRGRTLFRLACKARNEYWTVERAQRDLGAAAARAGMPEKEIGRTIASAYSYDQPAPPSARPSPIYTIITVRKESLPHPHNGGRCRCGCDTGYLARYIHANGRVALRWVCEWCESYTSPATGASDLPRGLLVEYGASLDDLPLRRDNTLDSTRACVVCGNAAVEDHHWAPVALFPDWPFDLTESLCLVHHGEWHKRLRDHGLRWPGELEQAVS